MDKYQPADFKWRHFHGEVIMQCVRWYCKYGISYRDLEEMMTERGLTIHHTTVYRWVQHYAPELKKRLEWHKKRYASRWHLYPFNLKVLALNLSHHPFLFYYWVLKRTTLPHPYSNHQTSFLSLYLAHPASPRIVL